MQRSTSCAQCGAKIPEILQARNSATCSDACRRERDNASRRTRRHKSDPTYRPRTAPISAGGAPGTRDAAPPPPLAPPVERRPPGLSAPASSRFHLAGQHVADCLRLGATVVHAYADGRVLSVFGGDVPVQDDDFSADRSDPEPERIGIGGGR